MKTEIRAITKQDIPQLKAVIDSTNLFPSDLLEGMTEDYFSNKKTSGIWLTKAVDGLPVAVAYCAPERMTAGTFNLYLIAIHKSHQGKGIGGEIMVFIENHLRNEGARVLIVETSGLPEFEQTRTFYDKCHYYREALIRDFYAEGEDKVVFWKKL